MAPVILTFVAVALLVASGGLLLAYRESVMRRLETVVSPQGENQESWAWLRNLFRVSPTDSLARAVNPFQKVLPRTTAESSVTRRRLMLAGYRKEVHADIFYGSKVLVPLGLIFLVTLTGVYDYGAFFVYALAVGLGFLIPDYWLGWRISVRQMNIKLALPEALDLMVICIEAGLGLDQAVLRVSDELRLSQPELTQEFTILNLEQRAGRPRAEAWKNLADRTDLDSVRGLVATLTQADHFGTSIANSLRVHSEVLRTERRQEAEEQAAKTTVKLVFPLVFFIFPSLFLVVLGPSLIKLIDAFNQYLL
jgi:tight adherence protein C